MSFQPSFIFLPYIYLKDANNISLRNPVCVMQLDSGLSCCRVFRLAAEPGVSESLLETRFRVITMAEQWRHAEQTMKIGFTKNKVSLKLFVLGINLVLKLIRYYCHVIKTVHHAYIMWQLVIKMCNKLLSAIAICNIYVYVNGVSFISFMDINCVLSTIFYVAVNKRIFS